MATKAGKTREEIIQQDVKDLHKLGYAQQLFREMGGFSNFAISFSIISILTGAMLLYGYGLKFAGPIINTVGWPVVSLFTLAIAASMAEIASAYPTAGGLYFWASKLGGVGWGWVTAWMNMVGQITITAGINIGAAIYGVGLVTRMFGLDPAAPALGGLFGWTLSSWGFYIFIMVLIMIPQVLINIYGIKLTALLNDFSVWWHIGGVLIIALLLTFFGKNHQPFSFAMQAVNTVNPLDAASATFADGSTGPALVVGTAVFKSPFFALFPGIVELYKLAPYALVFTLAFLQAQWTYTGYDASAHVAEETVMARLNSAWGVFLSVAVSAIVGYIVLMAFTLNIPDIAATAMDPYPVLYIAYQGLSTFFANIVAIIVFGGMWLCGLSTVTSMSRMFFAFARDDGMPFSSAFRFIHPRLRTPTKSIIITSILAVLVCMYSAAYFVVTSISTITLYIAYNIPVFLNVRNKLKKKGTFTTEKNAPWNLKGWGVFLNLVAVVYTVFISILLMLPPNELVMWTMVVFVAILVVYWFAWAKKNFIGPKAADEAELRRIEAEMAAAAGGKGDD
ncbi:MAG TPA: amino acid permease [Anaerolineales bacterium]|nr:amino acid permease [Anaerolineales bacterium]